jgi:hypothetical protein
VFGSVMTVRGYVAHRFPGTLRGRSMNNLNQPAPVLERAYSRGFAVLLMIAVSAIVVAGVVIVR